MCERLFIVVHVIVRVIVYVIVSVIVYVIVCMIACDFACDCVDEFVLNGNEVSPGQYPWMAWIHVRGSEATHCGGSLISSNMLLTAAHCSLVSKVDFLLCC